MTQGKVIELSFGDNGDSFWDAEALKQLTAQKPEELDLPLHLERNIGLLADPVGEVSVKFAITPQGYVIDDKIISAISVTGSDFVFVPIRLSYWRFAPPMHAGVPTGYCCVLLTIVRH